jgi:hypothetical protein
MSTTTSRKSKTSSLKRRSNQVEWTIATSKSQYRPIIFSFSLSNWERIHPPYLTESRWNAYINKHIHLFERMPDGIDKILLASLCNGIHISHKSTPSIVQKSHTRRTSSKKRRTHATDVAT